MNDIELIQLLLQTAPLAFLDLLAATALGGLLIAFACECTAILKKKAFFDKFAQQITVMSLWLLLLTTGAGIAAYFIGAGKIPGLQQWIFAQTSPALPLFASLGFTIFSLSLYKSTWQNLRQKKNAHVYLGAFAALGAVLTIYTGLVTMAGFAARFLVETPTNIPASQLYLPAISSPFWPLTTGAVLLCLTYGGGVGAAYLVHRRKRDDFGRDYYNFALPLAARWAIFPLLGVAAASIWLAQLLPSRMGLVLIQHPLVCFAGSGGIALFLTVAAWLPIALSKHPLRLKGLALIAPLLLWFIHALLLWGVLMLYPAI